MEGSPEIKRRCLCLSGQLRTEASLGTSLVSDSGCSKRGGCVRHLLIWSFPTPLFFKVSEGKHGLFTSGDVRRLEWTPLGESRTRNFPSLLRLLVLPESPSG
ncbi:hypothetical protein Bca4012_043646 [Brassica carinata]